MAVSAIARDFKSIRDDPIEGIFCELPDENNIFEWRVYIEGPKETPYQGGVFQSKMSFPQDFPMSPPSITMLSEFWHPNVHHDGRVCISILHPPGEDEMSGERPEERWRPCQTVSTVLISVISLLSDPNISSPANVDSSVEWRSERDKFWDRVSKLVEKANMIAPKNIKIPHPDTDPEERARRIQKLKLLHQDFNLEQEFDDVDFDLESEGSMDGNFSDGDPFSHEDNFSDDGDNDNFEEEDNEDKLPKSDDEF